MSSRKGRSRNSPDKSLELLIERLTATACRKEIKLNETLNSAGMNISEINSLQSSHRFNT